MVVPWDLQGGLIQIIAHMALSVTLVQVVLQLLAIRL
jgi:hypothetical protein